MPRPETQGTGFSINAYAPDGAVLDTPTIEPTYTLHPVISSEYDPSEQVLLEIWGRVPPCLYHDGKPIVIQVLSGKGSLTVVDAGTGDLVKTDLEADVDARVEAGSMYWYEAHEVGSGPLIVLDTCLNFDPAHEPLVADVHRQLSEISFVVRSAEDDTL